MPKFFHFGKGHIFEIATLFFGFLFYVVEPRNKFAVGDTLEILSPGPEFNKKLSITKMTDENGLEITDAKNVQQKIWIYTKADIQVGDILRK